MAIVERGDDGGLYVPPDLLRQSHPHAAFEIQSEDRFPLFCGRLTEAGPSGNGRRLRNESKRFRIGSKRSVLLHRISPLK